MRTPLILSLLLCAARAAASPTGGADMFNFLFLDAGARPVAMGGAYTALAAGADALRYNPAGLGMLEAHEGTFMHNQYLDGGLKQEYFAAAIRQGFGMNFDYLGFGRIPRTTYSAPVGTGLGEVGLTDIAVGAGYGRSLMEGVSAGVGYKFLRESADDLSVSGHAADLGVLVSPAVVPGLSLGAAAQNLGPAVRYHGSQDLPLNFRWGAAYGFEYAGLQATLSADGMKTRGDRARAAAGAEVVLGKTLALRAGFSGRVDSGPGVTAGVGVRFGSILADYAFVPYGSLGNSHRASVTWRWGAGAADAPRRRRFAQWPRPLGTRSGTAARGAEPEAPAQPEALSADERFARAEEFIRVFSYNEAKIELYNAAKLLGEEDRRRVLFHERLGRVAFLERDCPRARESYSEALKLASLLGSKGAVVGEAYAGVGLCLADEKNLPYARKFLLKALEAGPSAETRAAVKEELSRISE